MKDSIILIGMPGSGKSTLGVQLAKQLGLGFIDSDLLIQGKQQQKLQDIVDSQGYQALRAIEEQTLLQLHLSRDLVATGGSAVYSESAMQHLRYQGLIIYLEVSFSEIEKRIDNESQRGIARPKGQTLAQVYQERRSLYERYADITLNNEQGLSLNAIEETIKRFEI